MTTADGTLKSWNVEKTGVTLTTIEALPLVLFWDLPVGPPTSLFSP
jgi:hypothetical protein